MLDYLEERSVEDALTHERAPCPPTDDTCGIAPNIQTGARRQPRRRTRPSFFGDHLLPVGYDRRWHCVAERADRVWRRSISPNGVQVRPGGCRSWRVTALIWASTPGSRTSSGQTPVLDEIMGVRDRLDECQQRQTWDC